MNRTTRRFFSWLLRPLAKQLISECEDGGLSACEIRAYAMDDAKFFSGMVRRFNHAVIDEIDRQEGRQS